MATAALRSTVAIFNTSPDVIELLLTVLERAGFGVASAYTFDVRDGKVDLDTFIREHAPRVIVYDIAPPYEENWQLFLRVRAFQSVRDIAFVLTTTNATHVKALAGAQQDLHEIVGKPLDLDEVVAAVVEAAHARLVLHPVEPPPERPNWPVASALSAAADLHLEHQQLQRETEALQREHAYLQAHPRNVEAHREHLRKLQLHDQALLAHTERLREHQELVAPPDPPKDRE